MDISVVVPAYNEEEYIGPTLEALLQQDFKGSYEIIVVDNGSTDRTAEICRSHGVKVVYEPRKGVAHARQTGCMQAQADIIATTDADTIVPPDWLSYIFEAFRSTPNMVAFGGLYRLSDGPTFHRLGTRVWLPLFCVLDNWLIGGGLLGCNMSMRRKAFLACGGFNVQLKWNEDGEIARRIRRHGKIEIDRKFIVYTSGRRYKKGIRRGILPYLFYTLFKLQQKSNILHSRRFVRTALTGLVALVLASAALAFVRPPWSAEAEATKNRANVTIQKIVDEVRGSLDMNTKKPEG